MPPTKMTPELLAIVAERFKAFAEPARLSVLYALRGGEQSVSDLVEATGLGQANLSKHLQVLHAAGVVSRRKEGLFTVYALADADVLKLCDLVCGRLERETRERQKSLAR
jgi:DNA-binding transcriptional ArsR family regulator